MPGVCPVGQVRVGVEGGSGLVALSVCVTHWKWSLETLIASPARTYLLGAGA